MKALDGSNRSYNDLWEEVKEKYYGGEYGLNEWNFNKAVEKMIKLEYVMVIKVESLQMYSLTVRGYEYLSSVKKSKRFIIKLR